MPTIVSKNSSHVIDHFLIPNSVYITGCINLIDKCQAFYGLKGALYIHVHVAT